MTMRFTKMHGLGNDYVYVNCLDREVESPEALARAVSDRHTGVGSDGLILICPPHEGVDAHVRMRMFNADGSESGMCGNGVRCVCKYVVDRGLARGWPMRVETGGGVVSMEYVTDDTGKVAQVSVDMGEPVLELPRIPVDESKLTCRAGEHSWLVNLGKDSFAATFLSMGNPHAVVFVDCDVEQVDAAGIGAAMERHAAFPQRINVHFVEVVSRSVIRMRTWERGSGLTRACGSGACAVVVAAALTGRTGHEIAAHLPGGDLHLRWDARTKHVIKTGPAVEVFEGQWKGEAAASAEKAGLRQSEVRGQKPVVRV
jgi:diaminopimelate epimerase